MSYQPDSKAVEIVRRTRAEQGLPEQIEDRAGLRRILDVAKSVDPPSSGEHTSPDKPAPSQ